MSFFAELSRKISEGGKKVVKGVNDLAETAKLKDQIAGEEKTQHELFMQLGELLFENNPEQCQSEPFSEAYQAIIDSKENVRQLLRQLDRLQAENGKLCPECGARCGGAARFCGSCGSEFALPEPGEKTEAATCTGCGAELGEDDAFCMKCGTKVERELAEVQTQ